MGNPNLSQVKALALGPLTRDQRIRRVRTIHGEKCSLHLEILHDVGIA